MSSCSPNKNSQKPLTSSGFFAPYFKAIQNVTNALASLAMWGDSPRLHHLAGCSGSRRPGFCRNPRDDHGEVPGICHVRKNRVSGGGKIAKKEAQKIQKFCDAVFCDAGHPSKPHGYRLFCFYRCEKSTRCKKPSRKMRASYISKGKSPMNHFSDVHTAILQLLAECGRVSQSARGLTGYSYTYCTRSLKLLLDQQYIRKQGESRTKSSTLLSTKGRNHLAALNACRFRAEVMEQLRRLTRNPDDRVALRGADDPILSLSTLSQPGYGDKTPPIGIGKRWRADQNAVSAVGKCTVRPLILRQTIYYCLWKERIMKLDTQQNRKFLSASDVATILDVSRSTAYRIIRRLNRDLEKSGKITIPGKISSKYFYENVYL